MALCLAIAAWQIRRRSARLSAGEAGLFAGGFAAATFMLIPPVHTTNPALLLELVRRFGHGPTRTLSLAFEHLVFHGGCVLFKSSPWIGAGILLGLPAALAGWRRRAEIRVPLIVVLVYLPVLVALPIAQTFYMVPLLPPLALLASDQFFRLREARPRAAGAVIAAGFLLLGADLARCYPDYNLNGFQYLGARRLAGRSTVGYRGIVQVTTDGVQQALEWTMSRAGAGQTVVTYITAPHIVRSVCPDPVFRIEDGLTRPPEALREADYAVIGIGAGIVDDWGPPPARGEVYRASWDESYLRENFRKVFAVRRAFGFEVASVWEHRRAKSTEAKRGEAGLPGGSAAAPGSPGPPRLTERGQDPPTGGTTARWIGVL
jgi:hypothetical protein